MNQLNIIMAAGNGIMLLIGLFFALKRLFRGNDKVTLDQPIEIKHAEQMITNTEYRGHHATIMQRVDKLEHRTDRIEKQITAQTVELAREGSHRKDELLAAIEHSRVEQQRETRLVHERINPLLERIGNIDGKLGALNESVRTIELRTKK